MKYWFKLTSSIPCHPKGHGFIQWQVQTIKSLLNKCDGDGTDHYLALLQLRATPIISRLPSPAELLQSRQLKTTLPAIIRPPANNESIRGSLQSRQSYTNHDAHAKELPQLLLKQHVPWPNNGARLLWSPGLRPPGHMLCLHQMVIKRGIGYRYTKSCAQCTTQSKRKCAKEATFSVGSTEATRRKWFTKICVEKCS